METVYRLKPLLGSVEDDDLFTLRALSSANCSLQLEAPQNNSDISSDRMIKIQIANHPLYPDLLSAYIECQKVGAPPELACLLEEIARESHRIINGRRKIGEAPELDHFMETFCQVLHRYKEEFSRPFNEATLFLGDMESQLNNLCNGTLAKSSFSDEVANNSGASEEELSCGEMEGAFEDNVSSVTSAGDRKLKEMLLRKYSGHFSGLRNEFLKRRKKGKLPRDARIALMDWWNAHSRWPYPTEEEKIKLSEMSGLDQKQINNWFINQRKRHWKPTEEMGFGVIHAAGGPMLF